MSEIGTITLDTETTLNNKDVGNNKASPFHPDNKVVLIGLKSNLDNEARIYDPKEDPEPGVYHKQLNTKLLIGHHIIFDLHHLRKMNFKIDNQYLPEWLSKYQVWDTQLAEYLLSGQQERFASLDSLCIHYCLPTKDKKVTEMFKQGIGADKIDRAILSEYLKGDVINTEKIAGLQMKEAAERGMLPLIMSMMDALLAVQDMEYEGIFLDVARLFKQKDILESEIEASEKLFYRYVINALPARLRAAIGGILNLGSNHHLSILFFGGNFKTKEKVAKGIYKNGKTKFKLEEVEHHFEGFIPSRVSAVTEVTSKLDVYKVDEEVLNKIQKLPSIDLNEAIAKTIAKSLLQLRKQKKEYSTYYEGLSKLVYPDGLLHPNIHVCATTTGRTSSSEPNSQNIPSHERSLVKSLFSSRYGGRGKIISIDFKQLEVVALAFLSKDPKLIWDIQNNVDIHTVLAEKHYGKKNISKDERRVIKTINFGLIYGGTARTLAEQAGVTVGEARNAIDTFYDRYPEVYTWQTQNIVTVNDQSIASALTTKKGLPARLGHLNSVTGRKYWFREYDNPFRRGDTNFSPTEIKNWPVQGFAADIVLTMLGVIWRQLKKISKSAKLVNIVHDEYVFDVPIEECDNIMHEMHFILGRTPEILEKIYGFFFDLPVKVSVSIGDNWKELHEMNGNT